MALSPSKMPRRPRSLRPEEVDALTGRYPMLAKMRRLGIPMTRESYLNCEYLDHPPAVLGAEEEALLPPPFRKI